MKYKTRSIHIPMFQKLQEYLQAIVIFCLAFLVLAIWEGGSYYHNTKTVKQDMTKISNVNTNITPDNLNQFQNRKLIVYNRDCPTCKKVIPKYYGANRLVDKLSFRSQPIYLEVHTQQNAAITNQLGVNSTPKQAQILNIDYDPTTKQVTNLTQKQGDVQTPNVFAKLVMLNIFWSALLALIYLICLDVFQYFKAKKG